MTSPLNPRQLQMFMKPSELKAQPGFEFGDGMGMSEGALREWKLSEADHGTGWSGEITKSVESEGVRNPIEVAHTPGAGSELLDGHHRYFVQERREQAGEEVYLPVEHHSWESS